MARYQCFWIERLPFYDVEWTWKSPGSCSTFGDRHFASRLLHRVPKDDYFKSGAPRDVECACGFKFVHSQGATASGYWRKLGDAEEHVGKIPPGALFVDEGARAGFDGKSVVCVTPGGWWWIDSRASNCTKPQDEVHRCWVRHGSVGERLHVDKNGPTCQAGGGSIVCGGFHGFLHNNELYDC